MDFMDYTCLRLQSVHIATACVHRHVNTQTVSTSLLGRKSGFPLLAHYKYSMSHDYSDQSELRICLDNSCVEVCSMMCVMSSQLQQLDRAKHIITTHETTSPPPAENQATANGEGEIAETHTHTYTHIHTCARSSGVSVLDRSL